MIARFSIRSAPRLQVAVEEGESSHIEHKGHKKERTHEEPGVFFFSCYVFYVFFVATLVPHAAKQIVT